MRHLTIVGAVFALLVPAALAAPPAGKGKPASSAAPAVQTAAQQCKAQRKQLGMADFRALYAPGGSPQAAMDACLRQLAVVQSSETKNAAKECKAERAANPEAFKTTYGTNANKANAFGKCVSSKAKEAAEERQDDVLNAAKRCKAERTANPTLFANTHGTNANKRNAFGKCVSKYAREDD
ncbi:MAG TPA: hypothetical protein VNJ53_01805 [Gaiellaceae bacterium]|nr:hypothetical protein [Gaiellaceae bacterium]